MRMKRIFSIFARDLKSSVREFLLLYIILAPLLITVGFKFFIPGVNAVSFNFAVDKNIGNNAIMEFENYGSVEILNDREAILKRVNKIDDITGIYIDEKGNYEIILEGSEGEKPKLIASQIINQITTGNESGINVSFSHINATMSPIVIFVSASMIILAIVFGGIVIGLNIIEEKEALTVSALSVTPMSKIEFILGKSLIGIISPIVQVFIILWILNIMDVNFLMILVMILMSSFVAIILGFLIGVLSSNQIAGIANMKFLLIIVSASVLGAILLPQDKQFFVYWSPIYWSTTGFMNIVSKTATWVIIGQYSLWIALLTIIIFFIFKNRIRKGLS